MDTLRLALDVIDYQLDALMASTSNDDRFAQWDALFLTRARIQGASIVATFAGACRAAATTIILCDYEDCDQTGTHTLGSNHFCDYHYADQPAAAAQPTASAEPQTWVTRSGDSIKVGDVLRWTDSTNRIVMSIVDMPGCGYRRVWLDSDTDKSDFWEFFDGDAYDVLVLPAEAPTSEPVTGAAFEPGQRVIHTRQNYAPATVIGPEPGQEGWIMVQRDDMPDGETTARDEKYTALYYDQPRPAATAKPTIDVLSMTTSQVDATVPCTGGRDSHEWYVDHSKTFCRQCGIQAKALSVAETAQPGGKAVRLSAALCEALKQLAAYEIAWLDTKTYQSKGGLFINYTTGRALVKKKLAKWNGDSDSKYIISITPAGRDEYERLTAAQ